MRQQTRDDLERQEEEYRAYLEREVGDVKSLLTLDDEQRTAGNMRVKTEEASKEKGDKKKKRRRDKEKIQESDQDFLMGSVHHQESLEYYPY